MVTVAVLALAVVTFLAWLAQWWWSGRVEAQVASSLISPRPLGQQPSAWGRLRPRHLRLAHHDKAQLSIEGQPITAFRWANERPYWDGRAREVRRSFLKRTQDTADKWRTVFAGLLAVFGAVLVVDKPALPSASSGHFVRVALVVAIALALNAVSYTGWAAAGLPKMLVDLDAETAFEADTKQACRCLVRLRVGIICGALTAVFVTLAFAAALN